MMHTDVATTPKAIMNGKMEGETTSDDALPVKREGYSFLIGTALIRKR
jgi:hypothetical protein